MTDPATGFIKRCLSEVITRILLLREMSRCSGLWGWAERKAGLREKEEAERGRGGGDGWSLWEAGGSLGFLLQPLQPQSWGEAGSVLGSRIEILPERGWGSRDAVMQKAHSVV